MRDDVITTPDGRTVGFAEHGDPDGTPVLWCHGGPGSRLEPGGFLSIASDSIPMRVIGIDRPGYGRSTPQPDRTIAGWVPEGLAVADAVGLDRFVAVGVSTGGAYALALASLAPERVRGVVTCCALTDMRWAEGRAMVNGPGTGDVWDAPDRETAMARAAALFGEDGSKLGQPPEGAPPLPAADLEVLLNPAFLAAMADGAPAMFAFGMQGYADDRRADGPGWGTFDVDAVRCPVTVLHGSADTVVPVEHSHHTASIVPGARLEVHDGLGHFSIVTKVPAAVAALLA